MHAVIPLIITGLLLVLGVPIVVCTGLGTVVYIHMNNFPLINIGQVYFTAIDKFPFLAIPLFVLTGHLISESGIAGLLARFSGACFGWIRGGLGLAALGSCGLFAEISGSNSADAATMSKIFVPEMKKLGYSEEYSGALVAAGACTGIIIPPSITFIVYSSMAGVSTAAIFIGGVLPGILLLIAMGLMHYLLVRGKGIDPPQRFSLHKFIVSAWDAKYGLVAPAIILGSLYTGIATPTEVAGIAVLYCALVAVLTGRLKVRELRQPLVDTGMFTGIICPIIASMTLFAEPLMMVRLPDLLISSMLAISNNYWALMVMMGVIMIVAGFFMDALANLLILFPLFSPIVAKLGIDPLHWGVIMLTTLTVGFITPPVGVNLFAVSGIFPHLTVSRLSAKAWPFTLAMIFALVVIYRFPSVTLFLIKYMLH